MREHFSRRRSCLQSITIGLLGGILWAQTNPPPLPGKQGGNNDAGFVDDHLPTWLQVNAQYRNRVEHFGGIGFKDLSDTHDLTQLRLDLSIQPFWWLTLQAETQDAEVFFNERIASVPPYENTWDIRQAFIMLGNTHKGWFDLVAGRQNLSFGSERLIGPSNWSNMGRTFDAIRADLHHNGYNLSLFSASVIVARNGVIDHHIQGNNLHGAYGSLEKLIPHATLNPYVLWRVGPARIRLNENAGLGALNEVTTGFLLKGKLPVAFDYEVEMVKQMGSLGQDSIHSWAGSWHLGRGFDRLPGKIHPYLELNYASGTKDPGSREHGTFDQIYPSSHNKMGFADQIGWRNIEQVRPGVTQIFARNLKFTETYQSFWLASGRDALYSSSGGFVSQSIGGSAGRHVGQEVDAWAEWKFLPEAEAGFGYSHIFAGEFLRRTTSGKDFNYPFFYLTWHLTHQPAL
jgi:hypothetical protein